MSANHNIFGRASTVTSASPSGMSGGLYDNNPYVGLSYRKSPWQNFLSKLGLRTQADAWQENMSLQAAEYDAQVANKMDEREYDLPINQVARQRAAGLNPDINGGSGIGTGDPGQLGEDPSTPMQSTGEESAAPALITTFANGVMSAFSTGMGLVQTFQGIKRNSLENGLSSLSEEDKLTALVKKMGPMFLGSLPPEVFDDPENEDVYNFDNWQEDALGFAESFARQNLPRKYRKRFVDSINTYWSSPEFRSGAWKDYTDYVKNRKDYFNESSSLYSEDAMVMRILTDGMHEADERIWKKMQQARESSLDNQIEYNDAIDSTAQANSQNAQNNNDAAYFGTLDGSLQASMENAQNDVQRMNAEMVGILREALDGMIQKLDKASNEKGLGGALSRAVMAFLSVMQLYISTQGMPSVSRSTKSSSFNMGRDTQNSSSISLNF